MKRRCRSPRTVDEQARSRCCCTSYVTPARWESGVCSRAASVPYSLRPLSRQPAADEGFALRLSPVMPVRSAGSALTSCISVARFGVADVGGPVDAAGVRPRGGSRWQWASARWDGPGGSLGCRRCSATGEPHNKGDHTDATGYGVQRRPEGRRCRTAPGRDKQGACRWYPAPTTSAPAQHIAWTFG